jgi:hypothetical protein
MIEYIIILFLIIGIAGLAISSFTKGTVQMVDKTKNKSDESSSKDTNKSSNDTSKATIKNEDTQKQETPKQETKETQAPTVVNNITNNITNNNQVQNTTVIINEAQSPTKQDNSFLSNIGSNLVAELVVLILFAGISWFIKSKVNARKKNKLNMKKD